MQVLTYIELKDPVMEKDSCFKLLSIYIQNNIGVLEGLSVQTEKGIGEFSVVNGVVVMGLTMLLVARWIMTAFSLCTQWNLEKF